MVSILNEMFINIYSFYIYVYMKMYMIEYDDAFFFNRTRLERVGVVEPEPGLLLDWSTSFGVVFLCKDKKKEGPAGASPVAAPMPKSVPP